MTEKPRVFNGTAPHSADEADSEDPKVGGKKGKGSSGSFWRELPILVLIALVLALVIKTFAVQAFYIPSQSMENTLLMNDRVLVNKMVYRLRDIQRGDIVVFSGQDSWDHESPVPPPRNPVARFLRSIAAAFGAAPGEKDYIKRVVGVSGDRVRCCDAQGRITVNGVALEEDYLYPGNKPSDREFDVTVPPGRLWVMGDHRALSQDSRAHMDEPGEARGTIPEERVVGRAFVVVWPLRRIKTVPIPDTFKQSGLTTMAVAPVTGPASVLLAAPSH